MVTVSSEGADQMSDLASQIPEFGYDERVMICRKQIEKAVYQFIANTKVDGCDPAEVAMAIADIADDYILLLAQKRNLTH